MGLNL